MNDASLKTGSFTLPGEAGYEDLTIRLARKWGADTIRDSDGTVLSDDITSLGYSIYSTLCLVRSDNEWAKAHRDCLQQNYLMSFPVVAEGTTLVIEPMKGYFREQFTLNTKDDPREWWQVFDRTTGALVPAGQWSFDVAKGLVTIQGTTRGHKYTVNFLTVRIWEEISMYNHITNNWGDREHLLEIDPFYPEAQKFILEYLDKWLIEHPKTQVVRFTSMFYNFTWFWGDDPKNRYIYNDWADYQMMVSPAAMRAFEKAKGYRLASEDFVNGGLYCCTHNVPSKRYRDWMDFINEFVVTFGAKCVDLVHKHGKKAYMFYDDHWVGTEPYGERFKDFGFDGIIKCVFNGFEARKCAGVKGVETHELRLHPYLFPTGLKGEPTFKEGGNPTLDAKNFWINIRRALLREPVDRIGLGGYLHLVEGYPDFVDYIEKLANEFRMLKGFHADGRPYVGPCKVAILTAWGKLRSWICSGHMTHGLELNELIESLAGLPVDVEFISFEDILEKGIAPDIKVIINAGRLDTAWSGGDNWKDPKVVETITTWVKQGGGFIGIAEPSAARFSSQYFQLAHVLGVDRELGLSVSLGRDAYNKEGRGHFVTQDTPGAPDFGDYIRGVFALDDGTTVLSDDDKSIRIATRTFGKGRAVYFAGHKFSPQNVRLMHRAMFWAAGREKDFGPWTCSNIYTECAYYPGSKKLVVINNSARKQETDVLDANLKKIKVTVEPHGIAVLTA
jgi:beta-D-galactosyl-(1->4)-L-rhamnose phosphorylase